MFPSDNTRASDYNKKLSTKRTKAVNDYFVARGFPQSMMTNKGEGPIRPVYSIDTETGKGGNRRTEFVIVKINNYNG